MCDIYYSSVLTFSFHIYFKKYEVLNIFLHFNQHGLLNCQQKLTQKHDFKPTGWIIEA